MRGYVPMGTSWFVKILSPALFFMVDRYLNMLEKVCIDEIVRVRYLRQFMETLEKDWDKSLIMVCLFFSSPDFRARGGGY